MKILLSDATKLTVKSVTPTATQVNGNTVDALEITLENMTLEQVKRYFAGGDLLSVIHLYTDNMVLRTVYTGYEVRKSIAVGTIDGEFTVVLAKTSETNEMIKALDKAILEIRNETNSAREIVSQHTEDIAGLKSEVGNLSLQMSETQKSIEGVNKLVIQNAERCTNIEQSITDLNAKITEFTKAIGVYADRVSNTDAKATELVNQVNSIVNTTQEALSTANKSALKVKSYDESISYVNDQVNKLNTETTAVKDKVDTLGTSTNKLYETVNENAQKARDLLALRTGELSDSIINLQNDQEKLSDNINQNAENTAILSGRVSKLEPVVDYTTLPLDEAIAYRVTESNVKLEEYLASHPITSTCHNKAGAQYAITSDKQAYLQAMILMAQTAEVNNIPFTPSWNATGEECTYDWTVVELTQLALEIGNAVRPLVSYQQKLEKRIKSAPTMEALEAIIIDYDAAADMPNTTVESVDVE